MRNREETRRSGNWKERKKEGIGRKLKRHKTERNEGKMELGKRIRNE